MRILHVYKDYFPVLGGIENYIKILSEAHAAAGHHVIVAVCNPGPFTSIEELNGVKVIKSGRLTTIASMPLSFGHPVAVARLKPDVIHVHSPYPLGEVSAWLFKSRTPLVITHHSDVVRQQSWLRLYAPLLRRVLKHAKRILPTSPRYVETSPWLAPVKEKCTIVPLGVDHRRFVPAAQPFNGPPTLLFVGRLRYYKGLDTLLHALPDLPGVHFNVVGSGPMQAEWQKLAETLGVTERVHFLGEVPDADLAAQYHRAHIFVLPSNARSEAFGAVLLEAMASGLPCVSTELGTGTSWVVQDGVTGCVTPAQDSAAMAAAIHDMLADPERLTAMGTAARARVEAEFTLERLITRVLSVYEEVIAVNENRAR
ncbi:MAG: glycosyltransferase [Anaerolineae bacterium]|nr:glycosyltransferase [Anaerolineae bacterium]